MQRLDYERKREGRRRRPFWRRDLHPLDFVIIFGGMTVSTFSDEYLAAHGCHGGSKQSC